MLKIVYPGKIYKLLQGITGKDIMSIYSVGSKVLNGWHIVREIGQSVNGKVFEIKKEDFGITVTSALKVMHVPHSEDEVKSAYSEGMDDSAIKAYYKDLVDGIAKQIALMSTLRGHENIVTYEDYSIIEHAEGIGWDILIRMELLRPLPDYMINRTLSEDEVVRLADDICSALAFCEKKKLIHRDIKPENIFVNEAGQFKIGDFGIAKVLEETTGGLSRSGTESYMAPEVYFGRPYGSNADIYSLGITLYMLMNNNRQPFFPPAPAPISYTDRENALNRRMYGAELPAPSNADTWFSAIILKACAPEPQKRYSDAEEMLNDLRNKGVGHGSASENPGQNFHSFQDTDSEKTVGMFSESDEEKTAGMFGASDEEKTAGMFSESDEEKTAGMFGAADEEKTIGMFSAADPGRASAMSAEANEEKTVGMFSESDEEKTEGMPAGKSAEKNVSASEGARAAAAVPKSETIMSDPADSSASSRKEAAPTEKNNKKRSLIIFFVIAGLGILGTAEQARLQNKDREAGQYTDELDIEATKENAAENTAENDAEPEPVAKPQPAVEPKPAAEPQPVYGVTNDEVNLRDRDSTEGGVLKVLQKDEIVEILEELDSGWSRVIYYPDDANSAVEGFINSKYITVY